MARSSKPHPLSFGSSTPVEGSPEEEAVESPEQEASEQASSPVPMRAPRPMPKHVAAKVAKHMRSKGKPMMSQLKAPRGNPKYQNT